MQKLVAGYEHFIHDIFPSHEKLFDDLVDEQNPRALFITCSDSRIVPSLITSSDPGDLFLQRNAGNIVPPYGDATGGVSATIEYAVMALKVPHIVVCGHTHCGAMTAILHPEKVHNMPVVAHWLTYAESARRIMRDHYSQMSEEDQLNVIVYENVVAQIDNLITHPSVASAIAGNRVTIHGWVYDIGSGDVKAYDAAKGEFTPLGKDNVPSAIMLRKRSLIDKK
jgi:carbonic anhydrase